MHILRLVVVTVGISIFLFVLSRLSGDPASVLSDPNASAETLAATRVRFGLDRPILIQLLDAIRAPLTFDFPKSYSYGGPVADLAVERGIRSLIIVLSALVISACFALIAGIVGALNPARLLGRAALFSSYFTAAVPYFVAALMLILVFALKLQWLPATGNSGWQSYVIPVMAIATMGYATTSRLIRGQLLDTFNRDHILMARSKGVAPHKVLFRHALPIAAPPLTAWMGVEFSLMAGATLIIEPLVNFDGIGSMLISGVQARDFPLIQVVVLILAVAITTVNALFDVANKLIDPRIGRDVMA